MSVKDAEPGPSRPVVTLAAFYGAGGTVVGPRVAERLGVPFLDRGILTAVAKRLSAFTGLSEDFLKRADLRPTRHLELR